MVVKHLRVGTLVACVILQPACGLRAQTGPQTKPSDDQSKPASQLGDRGRALTLPAQKAAPARSDRYGDPLPDGAVQRLGTLRFRLPNGWGKPKLCPDGRTFIS